MQRANTQCRVHAIVSSRCCNCVCVCACVCPNMKTLIFVYKVNWECFYGFVLLIQMRMRIWSKRQVWWMMWFTEFYCPNYTLTNANTTHTHISSPILILNKLQTVIIDFSLDAYYRLVFLPLVSDHFFYLSWPTKSDAIAFPITTVAFSLYFLSIFVFFKIKRYDIF